MTTRTEHMAWCKRRALEELDAGNINEGFASMVSDLTKHPETVTHPAIQLGTIRLLMGMMGTDAEVRQFIQGFN